MVWSEVQRKGRREAEVTCASLGSSQAKAPSVADGRRRLNLRSHLLTIAVTTPLRLLETTTMAFLGFRAYPTPIWRPLSSFFIAGGIVFWGVNSLQNVMVKTDDAIKDPRNPYGA